MNHLAIIPDGNRRWAKSRGMEGPKGHEHAGRRDNLKSLFHKAKELGINYLSLWVFSTENWKRSKTEVDSLFRLLLERVKDLKDDALEENVKVLWVGRRDRVPEKVKNQLRDVEKVTSKCNAMTFFMCLDYGGRDEILRAVNKAIAKGKKVDEKMFSELLDTGDVPAVDMVLRTSGEQRLSGFMPWQAVYAELLFIDKHFPDFVPEDLEVAVKEFENRNRRFGGN